MSLELHLQQVRDPARRLRDEGCCGLCVLRLTGAPDRASYRQPLGSVERLLDEHVGGQQGGTRRSVQAARPRELPPGVAKPAAAAAADKSVRAFVTTKDATLFSGAKLVQVDTTDPAALRKSIAKAIGHEGVLLEVKLNGKAPLTSADAVQALGSNPRLEVARDATPAAAAAAVATPAATTATAATNSAPPPTGMTAPPGVDTQVQPAPGAATAAPEFVCCACLGILQHATSELCSEMITSIRRDGWECPRGQRTILGFAIPSDVLVRDRLLEMVGFPAGPPARRAFELKQTLTWLFESVLQEELGCQMVPAAVQDAGNYGMSIVLSWKPKSGVLSDAHRVAVRCGGANQHGQQSRKRQRPNNGGGGGSSVDTSWQTVQRLLSSVDSMKLRDLCEFPPRKLAERVAPMEMQIHRPSIYVAGRYSKFERGLSQTPWSYAEPGATSVQEIISDLLAPYFKPEKATFTSGGREDMDVRMLGSGRPFAFIMENPRVLASSVSAEQISVAEADVNKSALGRVEVNSLKIVAKSEIDALKGVEETKRKTYRCVCWVAGGAAVGVTANDLASKLDTLKELKVAQRTPLRVAHRRTGMVREKIIYSMSAELISSRIFILDMDTSAGTYVKEFVHGDLGRTTPSVGSLLGVPVDILQLDVRGIDYAM